MRYVKIIPVFIFLLGFIHFSVAQSIQKVKMISKDPFLNKVEKIIETDRNAIGGEGKLEVSDDSVNEILSDEEENEDGIDLMNTDNLIIDSMWLTMHDYFSVWDSKKVNPYEIDIKKFKDTINLTLYDTVMGISWASPIGPSNITSNFGSRRYRWHYGTDLKLNIGDTVRAAFDGIVRIAKYNKGGYGYYVLLRHYNGLETIYGHLSEIKTTVGQVVKAGEMVGLGGNTGRSTGPHLHFEVRYQGNAIDPLKIYDFDKNELLASNIIITPETFSYLTEVRKAVYHRIRRGDTLSGISRRYNVPMKIICRMNGISRNTTLRVGRSLKVR